MAEDTTWRKNDRLRLFGIIFAVAAFVAISVYRINVANVRPQLKREEIKKLKANFFATLTASTLAGDLGTNRESPLVGELQLAFLPDKSSPLVLPSDPAFPLKRYEFRLLNLEPLSPNRDPLECENATTWKGTFPLSDRDKASDQLGFRLESPEGTLTVSMKPDHTFLLSGTLKNGGDGDHVVSREISCPLRLLSQEELNQRVSDRTLAVRAMDAERKRLRTKLLDDWEAHLLKHGEYLGAIRVAPTLTASGRSIRVRATFRKGDDILVSLAIADAQSTEIGKLRRNSELRLPTESYQPLAEGQIEAFEVTVPKSPGDTFSAEVKGHFKSGIVRKFEGSLELSPMTKTQLAEERRAYEMKKWNEEKVKIERRQILYLLNRKGGFDITMTGEGESSGVDGHFEASPWKVPLDKITDIENTEIEYQLTQRMDGTESVYFVTGKLAKDGETIALDLVPSKTQSGLFSKLKISLDSHSLSTRSFTGEWSGYMPPTDTQRQNAATAAFLELLFSGKMRNPIAKGRDLSGSLVLRGRVSSSDDYLLRPPTPPPGWFSDEAAPNNGGSPVAAKPVVKEEPNKVWKVSTEDAKARVREYFEAAGSQRPARRDGLLAESMLFYGESLSRNDAMQRLKANEDKFAFREFRIDSMNVVPYNDTTVHAHVKTSNRLGATASVKPYSADYYIRLDGSRDGPLISRINTELIKGWPLAKYRARISAKDLRQTSGKLFTDLSWENDSSLIREIILQDRINFEKKRTSDTEDEASDYFKTNIAKRGEEWQRSNMDIVLKGDRQRFLSGQATVFVAVVFNEMVYVEVLK